MEKMEPEAVLYYYLGCVLVYLFLSLFFDLLILIRKFYPAITLP